MAFQVKIRREGIWKHRLEIEDLTAGVFSVGMQDRFLRFVSMKPGQGWLILFDPDHTGTGVRTFYDPEEKNEIVLSLPGITTVYDIGMLVHICLSAAKKWNAKSVTFEDTAYSTGDLGPLKAVLLEKTMDVLRNASANYDEDITLVHGARWPLMFETKQLHAFAENNDAEGFAKLLHDHQNRRLSWCACHVYLYEDQQSYQGVYTIQTDTDTIIPLKPVPPLYMTDPATGDDIRCVKYTARLVSGPERRPLLSMEYRQFMEMIRAHRFPAYDACHVVCNLDEEEVLDEASIYEEREGIPCW